MMKSYHTWWQLNQNMHAREKAQKLQRIESGKPFLGKKKNRNLKKFTIEMHDYKSTFPIMLFKMTVTFFSFWIDRHIFKCVLELSVPPPPQCKKKVASTLKENFPTSSYLWYYRLQKLAVLVSDWGKKVILFSILSCCKTIIVSYCCNGVVASPEQERFPLIYKIWTHFFVSPGSMAVPSWQVRIGSSGMKTDDHHILKVHWFLCQREELQLKMIKKFWRGREYTNQNNSWLQIKKMFV